LHVCLIIIIIIIIGITANIEGEISMSGVKSIYSFVSEEVQDMVDITDEKLTYILIRYVICHILIYLTIYFLIAKLTEVSSFLSIRSHSK